jgi:F0F1-type ATP synthase assembly protein I
MTASQASKGANPQVTDPPKYGDLSWGQDFGRGLSLSLAFAGIFVLGWVIGRFVDHWLGTAPWGQIVGSLLGFALSFVTVLYAVQVYWGEGSGASQRGERRE